LLFEKISFEVVYFETEHPIHIT